MQLPIVILPVRGTENTVYQLLERMGIDYRRAEHSLCGSCVVIPFTSIVPEWVGQLAADTYDQVYMVVGMDGWVNLHDAAGRWIIHSGQLIRVHNNNYVVE